MEMGNVHKTMRVLIPGWVVKALLIQLLWWKSVSIYTSSANILLQVIFFKFFSLSSGDINIF